MSRSKISKCPEIKILTSFLGRSFFGGRDDSFEAFELPSSDAFSVTSLFFRSATKSEAISKGLIVKVATLNV